MSHTEAESGRAELEKQFDGLWLEVGHLNSFIEGQSLTSQQGKLGIFSNTEVAFVRNRTLTLIEREDDTRSWGKFLVYFSHSTTMPYPPRGWGYILIDC
jgi:hypothetical protein